MIGSPMLRHRKSLLSMNIPPKPAPTNTDPVGLGPARELAKIAGMRML